MHEIPKAAPVQLLSPSLPITPLTLLLLGALHAGQVIIGLSK